MLILRPTINCSMKKLLVMALLVLAACKKDDTTTQSRPYDGKWFIHQTIVKQYTLNNGDTIYTRNDVTNHPDRTDFIDFQIDNRGKGNATLSIDRQALNLSYEAVTPSFFKLDSTLCEITQLSDSAFHFNTLIFEGEEVPDKIQVTQNFFILGR